MIGITTNVDARGARLPRRADHARGWVALIAILAMVTTQVGCSASAPSKPAWHVEKKPRKRTAKHAAHEHPHDPHPHAASDHHHHPHPHPHLAGPDGHHHPY